MSVTALTNSFYGYIPPSKSDIANTDNTSDISSQSNIKATDDKNINKSDTTNSYQQNNKNTLNNNTRSSSSYLTGEEILSSRPDTNNKQNQTLTEAEQKQVDELKARDREVKNHEQAHIAAGGSYVKGGASYDYQTGPDGKQYAVGGSVNIDTSPVQNNPEATIAKAQVIIKAALAPAEPSGQDQKVASSARQMMNEARQEINSQRNSENNSDTKISGIKENEESTKSEEKSDNNIDDINITKQQKTGKNTDLSYDIGSLISLTA